MTKDVMQVTTLRLPPALLKKIRAMAEGKGVAVSAVLRPMIVEGVARFDALKAVESEAGFTMAKKYALYFSLGRAFLERLMKDIRADSEDAEK